MDPTGQLRGGGPDPWTPPASYAAGCKLKQNANEGCNSCASLAGLVLSFIACFIFLVIDS